MERLIKPSEGDWTSFTDPSQKIAEWERRTGKKVPADYKSFMSKYDGGRIFPLIFDRQIPPEVYSMGEPATFLNTFYPWDTVSGIWDGEMFSNRTPPGMLVIGSSPGSVEVLLSVEEATYGQIFLWLHSQNEWGAENNDKAWQQAGSFRQFVDSLYEGDEDEGYDYWYLSSEKELEKKVEF